MVCQHLMTPLLLGEKTHDLCQLMTIDALAEVVVA
jgi:hypothetical protein